MGWREVGVKREIDMKKGVRGLDKYKDKDRGWVPPSM